jgi:hypothetical protein
MGNIPAFIDDYHLPPGEHYCTMNEIEDVFLNSQIRGKRWQDFIMMLKRLCELKVIPDSLLINGSFVTGRKEPGDVDFAVLIPPDTIQEALSSDDEHDVEGVKLFLTPENQGALRNIFGAHLLIAFDENSLGLWSSLFRKGQDGQLREPDSEKDPAWVSTPPEKGILRIEQENILKYIYGGDQFESEGFE